METLCFPVVRPSVRPSIYVLELLTAPPPPLHHFCQTPGSRCCHRLLMAALVSEIFWLRFCTVRGSEDTLSIFINVTGLDCCPLDRTPVLTVRMCCNIWQKTSYRSAHLQPHRNLHELQSMSDTIMILATKSRCFFSGGTENSFFLLSSLPQQNPAKSCVPSLNLLNFPSSHNSPYPLFNFQDLERTTSDSHKEHL